MQNRNSPQLSFDLAKAHGNSCRHGLFETCISKCTRPDGATYWVVDGLGEKRFCSLDCIENACKLSGLMPVGIFMSTADSRRTVYLKKVEEVKKHHS